MFSRFGIFSPYQKPNDRLLARLFRQISPKSARTTNLASLLSDALAQLAGFSQVGRAANLSSQTQLRVAN